MWRSFIPGLQHRCSRGFTLIELMITIAILAILASIGVPSLRDFIVNSRLDAAANEIMGGINYARIEAVKRGVPVTMCISSDLTATNPECATSGGWQQGWIVFVDNDGDATRDAADTVLRVGSTSNVSSLAGVGNGLDKYIVYVGSGQRRLSSGGLPVAGENTLTVCQPGYLSRIVRVNAYGRPSFTKSATIATSC